MSDPSLGSEIQRLEDQSAAHPGSLLFARLADLLRKSGELDRALTVVEEGLTQHPDYLSAHIVHARTLEDMGRQVQAAAAYRGVLELDGQNLVALRALARMADTSGDREGAAEWYGRLLVLDPRNEEAEAALERLVGEAGPEATPDVEPGPAADPEPEDVAEFEPEDVGELEPEDASEVRPEPDAVSGTGDDDAFRPDAGFELDSALEVEPDSEPDTEEVREDAVEPGPTDAFGLASDAFGLESGAAEDEAFIGSAGWPWQEPSEAPEPSEPRDMSVLPESSDVPETEDAFGTTEAFEPLEPAASDDASRRAEASGPPEAFEAPELSEAPEPYWPAWGGEALDTGLEGSLAEGSLAEESLAEGGLSERDEPVDALPAEEESHPAAAASSMPVDPVASEAESESGSDVDLAPEVDREPDLALDEETSFEPDEASDADLPTETLATLYATQGLYREAVTIYEELVRRRPHDDALAERLRAAREELEGDGGAEPSAAGDAWPTPGQEGTSPGESPSAGERGPAEPPVREHLRALLSGEAVPDVRSD
jgi:tetratricopeptide (TPR) repeat protein